MRTSNQILVTIAFAFLLGSCSSTGQSPTQLASNFIYQQKIVPTTKNTYPAKNPQKITLYTNEQKPLTPYRIIGVATVAKHNLIGMQREEATLNDMIKNLAASMGGDGLINVSTNEEFMEANIIQFQKILI